MKQQLLALSLVATAGLFAADGSNSSNNGARMDNGACAPECTPCCVPKPKKCIDCECYTPQFYDLQCDWGVFIDVEFLYWYARETNLSYAIKGEMQDVGALSTAAGSQLGEILTFAPSSVACIDSEWDPGFRVGIGWNDCCDGWDVYLNYTWYRNRANSSTSVPALDTGLPFNAGEQGLFVSNGNLAPFGEDLLSNSYTKVKARYRLNWNVVDLELGRKYWLSRCFNLRPFAALRGAWWKSTYQVTGTATFLDAGTQTQTIDQVEKNRSRNRAWGVGVVGGLQPTWYVCSNFALYSSFDVALIWGDFKTKYRDRLSIDVDQVNEVYYSNRYSNDCPQMTPMIDVGLGIRWEETWCCDQYRTTLDLGWEHHAVLDQNHRVRTNSPFAIALPVGTTATPESTNLYAPGFTEDSGAIGLGGFVLRLRFDF